MTQEKPKKSQFPVMEEEVLSFWETNKIFKKSVDRSASWRTKGAASAESSVAPKDYVFYDGPPFATGTPHYGHIVASLMKDVVPRYFTMAGFRVERTWGWDCHGLPIENIVEKELGTKSKKDIEEMGVAKFNELCRSKVLGYAKDWEKTVRRLGRWVDFEHGYKTMDLDYMESVWWVFKQLWDKGLIYEGYRSMHICPRCETTLSQFEVAEGYKDIKDLSATVKFELVDESGTFVLAWTTTPWTLIGNVALAVGAEIDYVLLSCHPREGGDPGKYIVAKKRLPYILDILSFGNFEGAEELFGKIGEEHISKTGDSFVIEKEFKGSELVGKTYKPLFDYYAKDDSLKNKENGWKIYSADFVTTEEGTGVVHIAPAFGEDDLNLGKVNNLPFIQHLGMDGIIKPEVTDFAGLSVKPIGDTQATDIEIIKYLAHHNLLFAKAKYEHSYPHCWRCDTPLLNYATSSWFVKVEDIKPQALKTAEDINWSPEHIKAGRFGQWLNGARDWSISRQRFWASVLPIWKCDQCNELEVFGSVTDLEARGETKINDLHKHIVDEVAFKCAKCDGTMHRVPDVLDTWFDSGSMPYAQKHYPFENKEKFEANFPAEFIAEGVDQTRAWFYYLHIIANGIFKKASFKNVIVNGIVQAEDGKKMSKKLQNYPDPNEVLDHYGSDALRAYLLVSPVMQAENLNFSEKGVEESLRKNVMILWNVYKFYELYTDTIPAGSDSKNILDQWILARLNQLINETTEAMNNYNLPKAVRPITAFIDDLSTWYLRRSRDRFKEEGEDKDNALATIRFVLETLAKVMAPFMPFVAESLWQKVSTYDFKEADKSVHLEVWPKAEIVDEKVLTEMEMIKKIVELALAKRDEAGIKIRQPLKQLAVNNFQVTAEYGELIKDELNVKEVICNKGDGDLTVKLDTDITPELAQEGLGRDLVRAINGLRKNASLTIADTVTVYVSTTDATIIKMVNELKVDLMKDTISADIVIDEIPMAVLIKEDVKLNKQVINIALIN
jgi:isoleucyl-tRNA synthetase